MSDIPGVSPQGPLPAYLAAGWQQGALWGQLALPLARPATIQLDEAAALLVTRVPAVCGDRKGTA